MMSPGPNGICFGSLYMSCIFSESSFISSNVVSLSGFGFCILSIISTYRLLSPMVLISSSFFLWKGMVMAVMIAATYMISSNCVGVVSVPNKAPSRMSPKPSACFLNMCSPMMAMAVIIPVAVKALVRIWIVFWGMWNCGFMLKNDTASIMKIVNPTVFGGISLCVISVVVRMASGMNKRFAVIVW